jgi:hypothetical protein
LVLFTLSTLSGLTLFWGPAVAQELEPRAYSPSPVGANFIILGGGRSTGGVVLDPSVPITDIEAEVNSVSLGYGRTFGLFGRSSSAGIFQSYVWATASGNVFEEFRSVTARAWATAVSACDESARRPALTPAEFVKKATGTHARASVVVVVPVGQYYPDKLINLGTNRWAFKPELGFHSP